MEKTYIHLKNVNQSFAKGGSDNIAFFTDHLDRSTDITFLLEDSDIQIEDDGVVNFAVDTIMTNSKIRKKT